MKLCRKIQTFLKHSYLQLKYFRSIRYFIIPVLGYNTYFLYLLIYGMTITVQFKHFNSREVKIMESITCTGFNERGCLRLGCGVGMNEKGENCMVLGFIVLFAQGQRTYREDRTEETKRHRQQMVPTTCTLLLVSYGLI